MTYLYPSSFGCDQVVKKIEVDLLTTEGRAPFKRRPVTEARRDVNQVINLRASGIHALTKCILTLWFRGNAANLEENRLFPSSRWPRLSREFRPSRRRKNLVQGIIRSEVKRSKYISNPVIRGLGTRKKRYPEIVQFASHIWGCSGSQSLTRQSTPCAS